MAISKVTAQLKSDDPIVARRIASGWYCEIGGKSFLLLDDAEWEVDESSGRRPYFILGEDYFVEIRPETVRDIPHGS